jgi:transcriptional regulator with XRE-family HTH domain
MATNIGKRILTRRQELGLTQEELAFRMGYKTKSAINKIELGVNDVSQSKVVKFAEALHTSVAYLMGWEEEKTTENDGLTEKERAFMQFVKSVPEDKIDMVLRVMKSIVEAD